jgi:hypothetical protein
VEGVVLVVDWLLQMGRKEGRSGRSSSGNGGERRFSMIQFRLAAGVSVGLFPLWRRKR